MKTTKRSIITLPNPHLRETSRKVGLVTDEVRKLIEQMISATLDWEDGREHEVGVALAAIQLDSPLKVVVIRNDFNNKDDRTFKVFINPEIIKADGAKVEDFEGCLSIKDVYGKVPRFSRVKIKALDENGKVVRFTANDFLARVFQHEIDHTKGKLFIDYIKDTPEAFFKIDKEGKLQELNYEKNVKNSRILW